MRLVASPSSMRRTLTRSMRPGASRGVRSRTIAGTSPDTRAVWLSLDVWCATFPANVQHERAGQEHLRRTVGWRTARDRHRDHIHARPRNDRTTDRGHRTDRDRDRTGPVLDALTRAEVGG